MSEEYIFVYGTLRKSAGMDPHHFLEGLCEYYSEGSIQGRLYEVNGYPGAVESDVVKERIFGELYLIVDADRIFSLLDEYEECSEGYPEPHEYVRRRLFVSVADGAYVQAWVYVYNCDVSGLFQIKSGDYSDFVDLQQTRS